jgi:AAA15 family ATPase/GTPase
MQWFEDANWRNLVRRLTIANWRVVVYIHSTLLGLNAMALETLRIQNFAGIAEATVSLKQMTVLIGPQASGKSVTAKLFFFFKEIIRRMVLGIVEERSKRQLRADDRDIFLNYFPPSSWSKGLFEINYSYGEFEVLVSREGKDSSTVSIEYKGSYDRLLQAGRQALKRAHEAQKRSEEDVFFDPRFEVRMTVNRKIMRQIGPALSNTNYFIPAGRSFFSTIQGNVFSFIADNLRIDPFLAEFGRLYEQYRGQYLRKFRGQQSPRRLRERVSNLVCGTYLRENGEDFIRTKDNRQVSLSTSSSGQQEVLPLAITLASLAARAPVRRRTFIIEEPEAHLYPTAQRDIVHLFAAASDISTDQATTQFLITTHSPYILSALNNLMYAAKIIDLNAKRRNAVRDALGDDVVIPSNNVSAYSFNEGKATSIIDQETSLVKASILDNVSNELAREFEQLMAIDAG